MSDCKKSENSNTGWAKSRYTVMIFFSFFTGIVNDGRELKCILYTAYLLLAHLV